MCSEENLTAESTPPASELAPEFREPLDAIVARALMPAYEVPAKCTQEWCGVGGDHPFRGHVAFPDDGLERMHELLIRGDSPLAVSVSVVERLEDTGHSMESPTVCIEDPDGREFTATEARGLAAALLVAAARLDEIEGAR